jgi:hypothetical protein
MLPRRPASPSCPSQQPRSRVVMKLFSIEGVAFQPIH